MNSPAIFTFLQRKSSNKLLSTFTRESSLLEDLLGQEFVNVQTVH